MIIYALLDNNGNLIKNKNSTIKTYATKPDKIPENFLEVSAKLATFMLIETEDLHQNKNEN